jgi:hypothetical protein
MTKVFSDLKNQPEHYSRLRKVFEDTNRTRNLGNCFISCHSFRLYLVI